MFAASVAADALALDQQMVSSSSGDEGETAQMMHQREADEV